MTKLEIIVSMILGPLKLAGTLFKNRDANETGLDDLVSDQIDALCRSLEKWLLEPKTGKG